MGACVTIYLSALAGWLMFCEWQKRSFRFDDDALAPSASHWMGGGLLPVVVHRPTHPRFEVVSVP